MELIEARVLTASAFEAMLDDDREQALARLGELVSADRELAHRASIELRVGHPVERRIGAYLLRQLCEAFPSEPLVSDATSALANEADDDVRAVLIGALGSTGSPRALDILVGLQDSHSVSIRFAISDVISRCAGDPPDARVVSTLGELARDSDGEVRWSAVFELAAWYRELPSDDLRETLAQIALEDGAEEIRSLASDALFGHS